MDAVIKVKSGMMVGRLVGRLVGILRVITALSTQFRLYRAVKVTIYCE